MTDRFLIDGMTPPPTGGGVSSVYTPQQQFTPGPSTPLTDTAALPGTWTLYILNGKYYLVYEVPVDADGDGQFDEVVPIAYETDPDELIGRGLANNAAGVESLVKDTLTDAEWRAMGIIKVGYVDEIDNVEENPFERFVERMLEYAQYAGSWVLDPEIMALTAAAWLENRSLSAEELAGTQWAQTHSEAEQNWLMLLAQDPVAANQQLVDNRNMVRAMFETMGVASAPDSLIRLVADKITHGLWTRNYAQLQVALLADPYKQGELDPELTTWRETAGAGLTFDTTQEKMDTVRDLVNKWLGPLFGGQKDEGWIAQWAGRLRNDPDAMIELTDLLRGQRLALFPEYQNPNLTYEDIAGPWRNLVLSEWGQLPEETDAFFVNLVRKNDVDEASELLRGVGLAKGIGKVVENFASNIGDAFGGQVVRAG